MFSPRQDTRHVVTQKVDAGAQHVPGCGEAGHAVRDGIHGFEQVATEPKTLQVRCDRLLA